MRYAVCAGEEDEEEVEGEVVLAVEVDMLSTSSSLPKADGAGVISV